MHYLCILYLSYEIVYIVIVPNFFFDFLKKISILLVLYDIIYTMKNKLLENLIIVADAIAKHNGDDCEVCIHDLKSKDTKHSIVYIVNNHVTGRKVGDSLSFSYLKNRKLLEEGKEPNNNVLFYSHSYDGKQLKCSTIYLKDKNEEYRYMLCINQDVSKIVQANIVLEQMANSYNENEMAKEDQLSLNVTDILEELINNSIKYIGKTPSQMTTEEKKICYQVSK